jgi:hypothetical protein
MGNEFNVKRGAFLLVPTGARLLPRFSFQIDRVRIRNTMARIKVVRLGNRFGAEEWGVRQCMASGLSFQEYSLRKVDGFSDLPWNKPSVV